MGGVYASLACSWGVSLGQGCSWGDGVPPGQVRGYPFWTGQGVHFLDRIGGTTPGNNMQRAVSLLRSHWRTFLLNKMKLTLVVSVVCEGKVCFLHNSTWWANITLNCILHVKGIVCASQTIFTVTKYLRQYFHSN